MKLGILGTGRVAELHAEAIAQIFDAGLHLPITMDQRYPNEMKENEDR